MTFTNEAFLEAKPDLIIQLIPLGRLTHRTRILEDIKRMLQRKHSYILIDRERGMLAIDSRECKEDALEATRDV